MDKLQQSLLNAKRFMNNDALSAPTNSRTSIPTSDLSQERVPPQMNMPSNINIKESAIPAPQTSQISMTPHSQMSKEAILNSKLPDAIKKAMIENPIADPTPEGTLSPNFINEVSKKMNSPQYSINEMRATSNSNMSTPPTKVSQVSKDPIPPLTPPPLQESSTLKETIKECLQEILKEENLLVEQKNITENLQLRVGNKIFTGNIKSVRTLKK